MSADAAGQVEGVTGGRAAPVTEDDFSHLAWWRRPRRLRRQLASTFITVALVSVVLIGGLNFVAARQLLEEGTEDQLLGVGQARARAIDLGIDRFLGLGSALAADLAVVAALESLDDAFGQLSNEELSLAEDEALDRAYTEAVVDPLNELDFGRIITLDDVAPNSDAARYAQFHYTLTDDGLAGDRRSVTDAGDGSTYSEAHAVHHEYLRGLADDLGLADLLLIGGDGTVVYTVEKGIDFGTNLETGPLRTSKLAQAVLRRLTRVPPGQAILVDQELYLPGGAQPVTFVATAVRRETELVGALVMQVSVDSINSVTTGDGRWDELGLSSGESYVVGPDRTLVSESRLWIEDPDRYLELVDDPDRERLIQAFGSPVGLQPVETEPVEVALDGQVFAGVTRNYLGQRTFTYATPLTANGVDWVVVADVPLSDVRGPLYDYVLRLGLAILIIAPIAGIVGLWLADRLTRPIAPVVDAALAVAGGERKPDVPDQRRDEFGDLARRLKLMAAELERQETALAKEYEDRRNLLLTVLPPRIVRVDGVVTGSGEVAETATVVAVSLQADAHGLLPEDSDVAGALGSAVGVAADLADRHGIERIRAAAEQYLFVAGLGTPEDGADAAIGFALALSEAIAAHAEHEEIPLGLHIGLSSGPVATGMLERGDLTFAAWGEPVRRALAIGALAQLDEVLVDASTAASATEGRWELQSATDVLALDGQAMDLFTLESGRPKSSDTAP